MHAILHPTLDCPQMDFIRKEIWRQNEGILAIHNRAREAIRMVVEFYGDVSTEQIQIKNVDLALTPRILHVKYFYL